MALYRITLRATQKGIWYIVTEHLSDLYSTTFHLRDRSGDLCEQKSFPADMGIVPPGAKDIRYKVSKAILSLVLGIPEGHNKCQLMSAVALALRVLSVQTNCCFVKFRISRFKV